MTLLVECDLIIGQISRSQVICLKVIVWTDRQTDA